TLPQQLGCTLNEQGFVAVDAQGRTSVTGVSAAGDMTKMMQQVIVAAADGAIAAADINFDLLAGDTH
ncbi:MAG: FAD-dependent oxidoreductase, partial [Dehalococcoidia bacterium]